MAGQTEESSDVSINLLGQDPQQERTEQRLTRRSSESLSLCLSLSLSLSCGR
jgi:hypothetical protein